jgi:hypothetical protein
MANTLASKHLFYLRFIESIFFLHLESLFDILFSHTLRFCFLSEQVIIFYIHKKLGVSDFNFVESRQNNTFFN